GDFTSFLNLESIDGASSTLFSRVATPVSSLSSAAPRRPRGPSSAHFMQLFSSRKKVGRFFVIFDRKPDFVRAVIDERLEHAINLGELDDKVNDELFSFLGICFDHFERFGGVDLLIKCLNTLRDEAECHTKLEFCHCIGKLFGKVELRQCN